jgi:hypothetical protein
MTNKANVARKLAVHHNTEVKRRFEKAATGGEEAARRIETIYLGAAQGTIEFNQKLLAIAQANVDAAFDCARELVGVTSPSELDGPQLCLRRSSRQISKKWSILYRPPLLIGANSCRERVT